MVLSINEAAERLGLDAGRVRRLAASGQLDAHKIGGRWLVDERSVARRRASDTRSARPLSPRSAWGLLWAADGRPTPWLAPNERTRALDRANTWTIEDWAWATQRRAARHRFRGHPSVLPKIRNDARLVRTGASVRSLPVDVTASDTEAYVPPDLLSTVVDDYALIASDQPNVVLLEPPADLWVFDSPDAPWTVVVVDLLDAGDDRSRRAARTLARRQKRRS